MSEQPWGLSAEYRRATEAAALFDQTGRGAIEVGGRDAGRFLQSLCTNDVLKLPAGSGCEAFFTTNKARVVAHAWVDRARPAGGGESFTLDVPPGLADKLLAHLDHYLVSEQVELTERSAEVAHAFVAGPKAAAVLEAAAGESLADLGELQHRECRLAGVACRVRRNGCLALPGYDVLAFGGDAAAVARALAEAGAPPAGEATYETLRVEAGLPEFGKDIDENRLVMEVNRTAQAISYTKGCFLGQEPIVMARDRGHVNRFLSGLVVDGERPVPPLARVFRDAEEVGQTYSSVVSPRLGKVIALAYLRRGSHEPGTDLAVEAAGGRAGARVAALPFRAEGGSP
jgi:folate-binding protein YgfZ